MNHLFDNLATDRWVAKGAIEREQTAGLLTRYPAIRSALKTTPPERPNEVPGARETTSEALAGGTEHIMIKEHLHGAQNPLVAELHALFQGSSD